MFDSAVVEASTLAGRSGSELAAAIADNHAVLVRAECRALELAVAWADWHEADARDLEYAPLVERARFFGGPGTPALSEFCVEEFGTLQGMGSMAAQLVIADALDLRWRLPRLWAQVRAGQVRAWQARKVAEQTRRLPEDACADVDASLAGLLPALTWGRFQKILTAAIVEADPEQAAAREEAARRLRDVWASDSDDGLKVILARVASGDGAWFMATVNRVAEVLALRGDSDPVGVRRSKAIGILARPADALALLAAHRGEPAADEHPDSADTEEPADDHVSLRTDPLSATGPGRPAPPPVVLHFHLSDTALKTGRGVVRPEHGDLLTLGQLREWLTDTGCRVTVRPVWHPADVAPVDAYEIPQRVRDAVRLRNLADTFPYGSCTTATMDLDHTVPYRPIDYGGPPAQTQPGNLAPMTRRHHRAVTGGRWGRRQPADGQFVFRSPKGYVYLVTNHGTLPLGRTGFGDAVWQAADPTTETVAA